MAFRVIDPPAPLKKLSTLDKHLIYKFAKYGELLEQEPGWFGNCNAPDIFSRKEMERLVAVGAARIDKVGQSTFAVFVDPTATPEG